MAHANIADKIPNLEGLGNVVPDGYEYYEKRFTPDEDLSLPTAYLKWYNLYPADKEITPEQVAEGREFLAKEAPNMNLKDELGFVIFHRAGSYLLLMIMTWRNTNEIWESAYYKEVGSAADYTPNVYENNHRGTYCVWELGAVWHERHAWVRFIKSKRDDSAKLAYINDKYTGQL
jgi:hypothetical protein